MLKKVIQKEIEPYRQEVINLSLKVSRLKSEIKKPDIDTILKELWWLNYKLTQLAKTFQLEWEDKKYVSKRRNKPNL